MRLRPRYLVVLVEHSGEEERDTGTFDFDKDLALGNGAQELDDPEPRLFVDTGVPDTLACIHEFLHFSVLLADLLALALLLSLLPLSCVLRLFGFRLLPSSFSFFAASLASFSRFSCSASFISSSFTSASLLLSSSGSTAAYTKHITNCTILVVASSTVHASSTNSSPYPPTASSPSSPAKACFARGG